jgi:tRNA (cytidine/uridine-2'-O-)-methyltransferase
MPMIDCALFEPDIPQNAGAIFRLGACLGVPVHIIHPAGFALTDNRLKRAGLDYLSHVDMIEHRDWASFDAMRKSKEQRLIALSTKGSVRLDKFEFTASDILLFGRESAGLSPETLTAANAVVRIPIAAGVRSLNVATAAAIAIYEALRQLDGLPG